MMKTVVETEHERWKVEAPVPSTYALCAITPHSAFRIPRFPSPSPRSGVTLTEVLISMAILAIGLLGAAAMFPVGGYFMQKGEIADRGAAIAQAAFADLVARGDLHPDNWQVWRGDTSGSMGDAMRGWLATTNRSDVAYQQNMNEAMGFVFVIDPLGTAAAARQGRPWGEVLMAPYAANINDAELIADMAPQDDEGDDRWATFMQDGSGEPSAWPVRRLTSRSAEVGGIPSEPVAQQVYSSSDDIAFSVDDEEVPTRQRVIGPTDANGNPTAAYARESRGDYSWMAMVAPTTSNAREALALDPSAYYFDVSVIVFFKRPTNTIDTSERLVAGRVISTGTGGGELLLTKLSNDTADKPFEELRTGQWVMVSGPHTSSTNQAPLFFTQWYRVLAIDDQVRTNGPIQDSDNQRVVGLRGPDWPWDTNARVRVGLFPGAVAVHTKTMRLETLGAYQ